MSDFSQIVTVLQNMVTAINANTTALGKAFPQATTTATTATAGTATLPSAPADFLVLSNPTNGTTIKVPYYND